MTTDAITRGPLRPFHGGLRLPGNKHVAASTPIVRCPLPAVLHVPMQQHVGSAAQATVAVGDTVVTGQMIGRADGHPSAHVHAPASGVIEAVGLRQLTHPSGISGMFVSIRCAAAETVPATLAPIVDWREQPQDVLRQRIRDCGVVGLGGAAFPTSEKLDIGRRVLILNGAECEPWIACDDRLMRERAGEVIAGAHLLAFITGATQTLLAIEDSMTEALSVMRAALESDDSTDHVVEIVSVPTIYPQGGERQLIQVLTGTEVPRDGLPRDVGVLVQNVATAAACWRAVTLGEPLTRRIVTVTGSGVAHPGNFDVALGTSIEHLILQAGGYTSAAARLLHGGPLMGFALPHDDLPIVKSSNCILVLSASEVKDPAPELPCIRCGACADVCPAHLLPQQLLVFAQASHWDRLREHGLADCIECGCCDLVCPSHIPLVEHYRHSKTELRRRQQDAQMAAAAKERYTARGERMQREVDERAARLAGRQQSTSATAVQAAIDRAQARQLDTPPE